VCRRIELRLRQHQTIEHALKRIDAEWRNAVTSLGEHLRGTLHQALAQFPIGIHRSDVSLLRSVVRRWSLLSQLENGRPALLVLLAQPQVRSLDLSVRDAPHANDPLPSGKQRRRKRRSRPILAYLCPGAIFII